MAKIVGAGSAFFKGRVPVLALVILILTLASRLGTFWIVYARDRSRIVASDTANYDDSAKALLRTGRFAVSLEMVGQPQTVRTPGYPAFLAATYVPFGERHAPVVVIQSSISVGTILLAYSLARRACGQLVATSAAALLALDPDSLTLSQLLLTETLFTFVLTVSVTLGIRLLSADKARNRWATLLGMALALATLIRPISYYLVFFVLVGLLAFSRAGMWRSQNIWAVLLLVAIPVIALVGGWQVRNYVVSGSWEFSHIRGVNLLYYRGADIVAQRDGITLDQARLKIAASLPDTEGWPAATVYDLYARAGSALIRQHPLLFFKSQVRGALKMMFAPGEANLPRYLGVPPETEGPAGDLLRLSVPNYVRKWLVERLPFFAAFVYALFYLLILYTGIACTVARIARGRLVLSSVHIFIWGLLLYFIVVSAGPEAYSRFRVPIMPFLALYAGVGISALYARSAGSSCPG
jgi:4-amino-4-deoxy-L-arabinose transferase-like glycosyltransferase